MDILLGPVSQILKKLIVEVKKIMIDFPLAFKKLASTLERILPIITDIEKLQKKLDPGCKDLNFLTKTARRAKKLVRTCPDVIRRYNIRMKKQYIKDIEEINQDFLSFCQIEMPLIERKDALTRRNQETTNISTGETWFDEGEQRVLLESFKADVKGKQVQEDEQFSAAVQESLMLKELSLPEDYQEIDSAIQESIFLSHRVEQVPKRSARILHDDQIALGLPYGETKRISKGSSSSTNTPLYEDEQRVLLESFKDDVKGKQVQEDEHFAAAVQESLMLKELSLQEDDQEINSAIQKSIFISHREEQVAKRRARKLHDDQIAFGLRHGETKRITNGSSSSTNTPVNEDEQRVILESFKGKQAQEEEQLAAAVQEKEQLAAAVQESLKLKKLSLSEDYQEIDKAIRESILLSHQEEQVAKRRARKLYEDEQRVLLESFKDDVKRKQIQVDEQFDAAVQDEDGLQRFIWESFKK